jgi:hypothetical protein
MESRRMVWAGRAACMGEMRSAYKILVGKSEGKRPRGRPRRKWEDDIRIDVKEVTWRQWTGFIWLRMWADDSHRKTVSNLSHRLVNKVTKDIAVPAGSRTSFIQPLAGHFTAFTFTYLFIIIIIIIILITRLSQ